MVALKISFAKSVNSLLLDPSNGTDPELGLGVVVVVLVVVLETTLGVEPSSHFAGADDGLELLLELLGVLVAGVIVYDADGAVVGVLELKRFAK